MKNFFAGLFCGLLISVVLLSGVWAAGYAYATGNSVMTAANTFVESVTGIRTDFNDFLKKFDKLWREHESHTSPIINNDPATE